MPLWAVFVLGVLCLWIGHLHGRDRSIEQLSWRARSSASKRRRGSLGLSDRLISGSLGNVRRESNGLSSRACASSPLRVAAAEAPAPVLYVVGSDERDVVR